MCPKCAQIVPKLPLTGIMTTLWSDQIHLDGAPLIVVLFKEIAVTYVS